jgi:hypothetical protein
MYSKLALTEDTDRPVAISGIEARFASTFETRGRYGTFECFLHRSLLWQRSGNKRMNRIKFPAGREVPTWSWMSYDGEISYMKIEFSRLGWSDVVELSGAVGCFSSELKALVGEFFRCKIEPHPETTECAILDEEGDKRGWLKYDGEDRTDIERLKCVVIGRELWASGSNDKLYYVLVVTQRDGEGLERVGEGLERVGIGYIQEGYISFEGESLRRESVY